MPLGRAILGVGFLKRQKTLHHANSADLHRKKTSSNESGKIFSLGHRARAARSEQWPLFFWVGPNYLVSLSANLPTNLSANLLVNFLVLKNGTSFLFRNC